MPRPGALNRREWLHLGALGTLGLSLPRLLRAETAGRPAPAARSCVLFLLHGGPSQLDTWDTHFKNNKRLKEELLPPFDQCFSAFLEDLELRGLLASTLVVCMGEFGRTPRFGQNTGNGVDETGRDHWPQCYSLLVAGGPARGGRVLGRSDRFAAYPADDPYTPQDLTASILHALGVDPYDQVPDAFGRRVPLSTGRVRTALFAG